MVIVVGSGAGGATVAKELAVTGLPGTIEKVSDFLIFHPLNPTFSLCLQIVNYHKVIPHRLPVKTHIILTQNSTKTSKTAITRVKR
ncbi:hypothetical protein C5S39_01470 [Candidatus Methanophagaceae archaeon]|nr:hypothetical protein C5S39_01470 [Methanophagales archaeon]